jgi:hypothetical protein
MERSLSFHRRLFLLLLLALTTLDLVAAPCDQSLLEQARKVAGQVRYQARRYDDRCEGFYHSRVSAGRLELMGLLQRPLRFGRDTEALSVRSAVPGQAVLVRGRLIPPQRYYRLDAALAPGRSLRWPLRLLTERGYRAGEVALYGRLAAQEDWLVPLDVQGDTEPAEAPRLILRAPVELTEVRWRSAAARGLDCPTLRDVWKAGPAVRAYKPILIPLSDLAAGDRVCVEIQADAIGGDLLSLPLKIMRR